MYLLPPLGKTKIFERNKPTLPDQKKEGGLHGRFRSPLHQVPKRKKEPQNTGRGCEFDMPEEQWKSVFF